MLKVVPGISRPSSFIRHMNFGVKAILIVSNVNSDVCTQAFEKEDEIYTDPQGRVHSFLFSMGITHFPRKGLPKIQIPFVSSLFTVFPCRRKATQLG